MLREPGTGVHRDSKAIGIMLVLLPWISKPDVNSIIASPASKPFLNCGSFEPEPRYLFALQQAKVCGVKSFLEIRTLQMAPCLV